MAFESTAINELIAGLQNRPLERDSSDWLFAEHDDATEISPVPVHVEEHARAAGHHATGNEPFAAPRSVAARSYPSPAPFGHMTPLDYPVYRPPSPTTHVRGLDWRGVARRLVLPTCAISIASVAVAVFVATRDGSAGRVQPRPAAAALAMPATPQVTPIEVPAPAPKTTSAPVAKTLAPVAKTPAPVAKTPAPVAHSQTTATSSEPVASAPKAAARPAPTVAKAQPPVHVEPGSPASRFLAPPPVQPTIPTVAPAPAPAPQTVPDLVLPETGSATDAVAVEQPAPKAKPARKTAAQRRAERRAAAKRAARIRAERRAAAKRSKRAIAAKRAQASTSVRSRQRVAAASKSARTSAIASGKGVLSIASSPSMQVWVDGRNSKAMTPVRILLRTGKHKVTLIDTDAGKSHAFTVDIADGETTKVTKRYE